jgi:SAM-dependent methyltransferase
MRTVLNAGCGPAHALTAAPTTHFPPPEWREIRLDADAGVAPDVVSSITALPFGAETLDAVWSSHCVEHLHANDVALALGEFRRVLRPGGLVLIAVPDLQQAAALIAAGRELAPAYLSPAGPITPLDIVFGHRGLTAGNPLQQHRTDFTVRTLTLALCGAGFGAVHVSRSGVLALLGRGRA